MEFPSVPPKEDAATLWALQQVLLQAAEMALGPRDTTKKIYQPVFHDDGPRLRNTATLDGAFVELSRNAENHWPAVVFELAHESVHLLDPTVHYTNWLEEGVAVEFSIQVPSILSLPFRAPSSGPYAEALAMVRSLPGGALASARRVREHLGALRSASYEGLIELFPHTEHSLLQRLSEQCVPR